MHSRYTSCLTGCGAFKEKSKRKDPSELGIAERGSEIDQQKKRRHRMRKKKCRMSVPYSASHSGYLPGIGPARVNPNLPATVGKNGSTTGHNHDPYFVDPSNVVAMDCEMVGVGPMGQLSVLARVSIVNWHGCVLLDTFVKVQERVSDYRTFVSGVRPEDLTGPNSMDFGSVRHLVQKMLRGKILVGHGLTNDLKVMHLNHPWHMTRDSATYQPLLRANMQPRRLKELAWTELGMVIQRNGCVHDSVEDARAAMEVYKRYSTRWDYDICCTFPRHRPGVPAYFSF